MRRIVLPAALLLLSACTSIPLPKINEGPRPALELKVVAYKRPPQELVSYDGGSCFTTERRFQRAQPGRRVWCVWAYSGRYGDARPGPERAREP